MSTDTQIIEENKALKMETRHMRNMLRRAASTLRDAAETISDDEASDGYRYVAEECERYTKHHQDEEAS